MTQVKSAVGSSSTLASSISSLQKCSKRFSIDSSKSINSTISGISISLPDGAEASDIKGKKAFEALSENSEKSSKSISTGSMKKFGGCPNLRKDVVWKGLLRNMKKYYSSKFKNYFNYSDPKFIRKPD